MRYVPGCRYVPEHTASERSQNHAYAPPPAAVKFALPSTPEQAACSKHIDEGLKTFWSLVEHMQHAADQQQAIHQVEETLFRSLLVIGRWLLQAFLDLAGTGDVGPTLTVSGDSPSEPGQELPRLDQLHKRPYLSIFGEIAIERTCSGRGRVEAAPLDGRLHLPQRQYSYLLQQWLGTFVVDDAHAEAIRKLGTILGVEIAVRASEDLNREQASDVEVFQDRLPVPDAADEGPLLVVTADCKGVPLVRKALPPDKAAGTPLPALANQRRGKGEKANKKKMAAVGAVYTIEPFVRNGRRCDRGGDAEGGARASPLSAEQTAACGFIGRQSGVVRVVGGRGDPPQSRRGQARDLPLRWGTGPPRPAERVLTGKHSLHLGFVSCHGTVVEGGLVFLRGGDPEARGTSVGGRASRSGCWRGKWAR